MNEITAKLDDCILLDLRIDLRRGSEPSTFRATAPLSGLRAQPGQSVSLCLREGGQHRRLEQFRIDTVTDLGDGRAEIHGADIRQDWAKRRVELNLNLPSGDGTAWEPASINGDSPWGLAAAISKLFQAAGLDAPAISGPVDGAVPLNLRFSGTPLNQALQASLAGLGLGLSVSDSGEIAALAVGQAAFRADARRLMEMREEAAPAAGRIQVLGGQPVEILNIESGWECVSVGDGSAAFSDNQFYPLSELLDAWGVSPSQARKACLSDGGFERLLAQTGNHAGARLSSLKRYAFRAFRAPAAALSHLPWLPVGSVAADGTLHGPVLRLNRSVAAGAAPDVLNASSFSNSGMQPTGLPFEVETQHGIVILEEPPFELEDASGGDHDPTLQDRRLKGDPKLALQIAVSGKRPAMRFEFPGQDSGHNVSIHAPQLIAVYDANGTWLNEAALRKAAAALAQDVLDVPSRYLKCAGLVDVSAGGPISHVAMDASERGLITTIEESGAHTPATRDVKPDRARVTGRAVAPMPSGLHQPINAYRAGPLIVRTGDNVPETEGYLAVEASRRDAKTRALELGKLGPLAHAFHLPSTDPALAGRWFFVAGVEVVEGARLRVLGKDSTPEARHDPVAIDELAQTRKAWPRGMRGLLVSLGDGPKLIDAGPLVSDGRGSTKGAASNYVTDLEGDKLSAQRRGALHFLTVLAYSPAHAREGNSWVPALNFRDERTSSSPRNGRGLFAEKDGKSLGRLTASDQGGPILGDARHCSKHRFGAALASDGQYLESSGHLSTESFFKVPGQDVFDAPLAFNQSAFAGGVPPWPPYEAQIKYDLDGKHTWNGALREGLWRIQYRVPFSHMIPPTWVPPVRPPAAPPVDGPPEEEKPVAHQCVPYPSVQPAVSEYELWAPSHDWVPVPSAGEVLSAITFPGPALKSAGWAGENAGVPDFSLGGGALLLAPLRGLAQAQSDSGSRQTYFALHPEVSLAFGFPKHAGVGAGRVHSGWQVTLDGNSDLQCLPLDADAATLLNKARGLHVTGHLQVGKSGATFGSAESSGALRLAEGLGEGISFGPDTHFYAPERGILRTDGALEAVDAAFSGKLTVGGVIDPTGLQLEPVSANPGSPETLWVDDGSVSGDAGRAKFGAQLLAYLSDVTGGGLTHGQAKRRIAYA